MARRDRAFAENAPGGLFVDRSCIDCGTCYTHAPQVFAARGEHSFVYAQPRTARERELAHEALAACPTASIGGGTSDETRAAAARFPLARRGGVSWLGFTSPQSFGAWSWSIERGDHRLVVDVPRANAGLAERVAADASVSWIALTHIDDIGDHAWYASRWSAPRVMHAADAVAVPGIERLVEGDAAQQLEPGVLLVPTPGHTAGAMCLLVDEEALFTGDTLWWSPTQGRLSASRTYCWGDWEQQLDSIAKLRELHFRSLYPGHGAPLEVATPAEMRRELERCLLALMRGTSG